MTATITSEQLADSVRGQTVATRFAATVAARPDAVALRWKTADDAWGEITWGEYADQATRLAAALRGLGVERGDRVALMLRNRPEFHVADVAAVLLGATPISIYNSSAPEQIEYLVNHSEAKVAIVEDIDYLERFLKVRTELPKLQQLVVVDDPQSHAPGDVQHWGALLEHDPVPLAELVDIAQPDDLATVIYTSGTTGPPKGVMIDHANVCWTVECLRHALEGDPTGWRVVSYLPMAHIAERMTSHYQGIFYGFEVTTCPEPTMVAGYLGQVHPQIFFAVPRIWEKAYATITSLVGADPAGQAAFEEALEIGWQASEYRARDEELPADLAAAFAEADGTTLSIWRGLIGLDQCEIAVTGAAPIPFEIFRFFRALGVPLSEIYGLSETSGPMTWAPLRVRPGTVGPPCPGVEVRLGEDGEVQCRGGNVFRGYLNAPDKTAEVLSPDGWFSSGDIGAFDDAGYLKLVDRKKELIITAGGKNISPANLEAALKSAPLIGQACVIGDGRPFVGALIVLDPEVAPVWAAGRGIGETALEVLAEHPEIIAEIQRAVDKANERFSNVERVKKFRILANEWLPDSEELTPTMKLKRRGIHAKYSLEIEALYT